MAVDHKSDQGLKPVFLSRLREVIANITTPRALLKKNINRMEAEKQILEKVLSLCNLFILSLNQKNL